MVPCAIEETSALRSDASVDVEDEVDGVAGKIIEKKNLKLPVKYVLPFHC